MHASSKFIIGAVATSLMAMAAHSVFGLGDRFVTGLAADANAAIAAQQTVKGITAAAVSDPALDRVIILSGSADEGDRKKLVEVVRRIPGVKDARWAVDAAPAPVQAAPAAAPETPATAAAVRDCQGDVDGAIAGKTVQFDSGAATIKAESTALIAEVATALADCSGVVVEVAGHTDLTGNAATNLTLSEQRAAAVVAALVERGVPANRVRATGYGVTRPAMSGMTAAANAANRRIEFAVASAPAAPGAAAE